MTPGRYNEHELRALTFVCLATGQDAAKLRHEEADNYLKFFYNVPHSERREAGRVVVVLGLISKQLNMLMRCEFDHLRATDPELAQAFVRQLDYLAWEFERLKDKAGGAGS
jgi:hypothetical protein